MTTATPTLDKLAAEEAAHHTVCEFLEWLRAEGMVVARFTPGNWPEEYRHLSAGDESALALRFLGLDPRAAERERRMLLRSLNGQEG